MRRQASAIWQTAEHQHTAPTYRTNVHGTQAVRVEQECLWSSNFVICKIDIPGIGPSQESAKYLICTTQIGLEHWNVYSCMFNSPVQYVLYSHFTHQSSLVQFNETLLHITAFMRFYRQRNLVQINSLRLRHPHWHNVHIADYYNWFRGMKNVINQNIKLQVRYRDDNCLLSLSSVLRKLWVSLHYDRKCPTLVENVYHFSHYRKANRAPKYLWEWKLPPRFAPG